MSEDTPHPINAFPPEVQQIINHYSEIKGYPTEFFLTAFLGAVSVAVGRSVTLRTGNYTAIGIVWAATIAKPGMVKSEAQTDAFRPLVNAQFQIFNTFNNELAELEEYQRNNPKDKRVLEDPQKFILSDITPESLSVTLSKNPKGCGILYDELAGFVNRFDRYAAGGDEQMFLSLFNGDTIIRTRINSHGNAAIKNSFLTIIGTIQPSVMKNIFANKSDSGFFDRWLMCYPEDLKKQYPNPCRVSSFIEGQHKNILITLLNIPYDEFSQEMAYCEEAFVIVNEYQRHMIDIENSTENDVERSILAKMEIYLHRFALLLQCLIYSSSAPFPHPEDLLICSKEAAEGAVILCKYYISQAFKMRTINPIESLKDQWKEIYFQLPEHGETFKRSDFVKKCAEFSLSARRADEFLKQNADRSENKLLYKMGQGIYTKNLF